MNVTFSSYRISQPAEEGMGGGRPEKGGVSGGGGLKQNGLTLHPYMFPTA